ncbi:MAG: hypothetical protein H2054_04305 [Sphingomonas sp.]|uniref:hypothetical protein n=1 Tax=Sphingomonas sp. TaxID=28214 RepID=UPI0017BB6819|nr:hypothetical protein [Zymomonas sp.]MBA4772315.1 hypothetical protein [Sphingomonas sp.]
MRRLTGIFAGLAVLMLAAVMPFGMAGGVCHIATAISFADTTAIAHKAITQHDALPVGDCEMQLVDDCCTNCCVVAPAPRLAVGVLKYAAYRPHVAPSSAHSGWSTAPPQRPPRA